MAEEPQLFRSLSIISILSALFILSLFFRVSNAVIAPDLIKDLHLNAETLGILGGAYFYSFALLQIPIGPMLDRIGPRMIITFFPLIGALGAFLFAIGESFTLIIFGRILVGVGMASILVGAMKVYSLWFPPEKFVTLLGITVSIGTLGNILAASPLVYLNSIIGWRMTFIFASGITVLLAFMVFWILREKKGKAQSFFSSDSFEPETGILPSILILSRSLAFWQIGMLTFFRYGTFVSLQGLWLGLYLIEIKGFSPFQAGNVLILLAIGTILGGPFAGQLSDRTFHSRKGVALWGLTFYTLSLFPLIGVLKIQSLFWYRIVFFFIGFFGSFDMIIFSHAKELFPTAISGTVMSGINFFTMAGAAVFMPAIGKIIEFFPHINRSYPAEAYHISFCVCFLSMVASLVFYAFSKKEIFGGYINLC